MTDLPFGREEAHFRILLKGNQENKDICHKSGRRIDTGDIFFKRDLDLYGTAEEILCGV